MSGKTRKTATPADGRALRIGPRSSAARIEARIAQLQAQLAHKKQRAETSDTHRSFTRPADRAERPAPPEAPLPRAQARETPPEYHPRTAQDAHPPGDRP